MKKSLNKTALFALILVVIALLFPSCADVSHVKACLPPTEHTYGFWAGLWHGSIMIFSLIGEIFSDDIAIYAVNNTGGWYDLGFCLGLGGFLKIIGGILNLILGGK